MQQSSPQFSPKVYQLAETYQLGAPLAQFRWTLTGLEFILMTIAGFWIILLVVILTHMGPEPPGLPAFIGMYALLLVAVAYFVECFRRLAWRVYIFANGFIYLKYGKPDVFRWDDIYTLRQKITRRVGNANPSFYYYEVERSDGHKIRLNNHIRWIGDLGDTLNQRVTAAMLPEVLQEYNQGQVVEFGPLEVSQEGIDAGPRHLPWSEVHDISLQNGYVIIYEQGDKPVHWGSIAVYDTPNVFVFLALAKEALKAQAP